MSDEIKKILFNKYNILSKLCQQSVKINLINTIVRQTLLEDNNINNNNQTLIDNIQVLNLKNNLLTIETSRSEYLTLLRYNNQNLLYKLRQHPELASIIKINYKVNPDLNHLKINTKQNYDNKNSNNISEKISDNIKNKIVNNIDSIQNDTLREKLISLLNKI